LPERSAGSGHNRPIVGRGNSLTISGCRRHQHTRGGINTRLGAAHTTPQQLTVAIDLSKRSIRQVLQRVNWPESGERILLSDERCNGAALIQLAQEPVP
jgi:hypothetical protein